MTLPLWHAVVGLGCPIPLLTLVGPLRCGIAPVSFGQLVGTVGLKQAAQPSRGPVIQTSLMLLNRLGTAQATGTHNGDSHIVLLRRQRGRTRVESQNRPPTLINVHSGIVLHDSGCLIADFLAQEFFQKI